MFGLQNFAHVSMNQRGAFWKFAAPGRQQGVLCVSINLIIAGGAQKNHGKNGGRVSMKLSSHNDKGEVLK